MGHTACGQHVLATLAISAASEDTDDEFRQLADETDYEALRNAKFVFVTDDHHRHAKLQHWPCRRCRTPN
jgi:hypothetical protein